MPLRVAGRDGETTIDFPVERVFNIGSATRDPEAAKAHQQEVAEAGIRIAFDVPIPRIYPLAPFQLVADDEVYALHDRTSGEAEIVLFVSDDLYVGVGSDHTDRALERISIPWSKQVCPDVIASSVWRWSDLEDHWDACVLECDIGDSPYQRVGVDTFWTPPDVVTRISDRLDLPERGYVVFCGSYVSIDGKLRFGPEWTVRLLDPVLGRKIEHSYQIRLLMEDIREGYRVPIEPRD
jgi:4-hydroxyphenylacetate 3-monooxygenase